MKKKLTTILLTGLFTISSFSNVFAATWIQDEIGWWYQNDDKSYPANGWYWIDGNRDGIAECYYFNESGYCLMNTTTPDGYSVDMNGAWIADGIVQTQTSALSASDSIDSAAINQETILTTWSGNFPYVTGMVQEKPAGVFWTININTGKYHATANVDRLLPENTRYYAGDASTLESYGYSRCQKRGCY